MLYKAPAPPAGETREQYLMRMLADNAVEYEGRNDRAQNCLRAAGDPCDGEHLCEEEHDGEDCDCDLDCQCPTPDESRQDALIEATLAHAAALAMNTFALMLAHKL